ncbi:hypothetical protein WICPIJ_005837 [Wickerhamomyces pijperi]|uniref:Enoyl reductase (ER) domain-containing protein n=1 Tax=Wickerhamomyces pijperi TaxID=599730 RepID=A0A9P8Q2V6_WICPI|nr:hypothetical protein WICPIJ_005837 [Wickerhamomyces pijperi]
MSITVKKYLLNQYATFDSSVNLNYESPDATFKFEQSTLDISNPNLLQDDEIFYETIYLSNDPAQKGWFTAAKDSYLPPTPLGQPAPAHGIAKILKSKNAQFPEGSYFMGKVNWVTHGIVNPAKSMVFPVDPTQVQKLSHFLSVFGSTGMTAYVAAFKYSEVKPEDEGKVWLITGAAGAVGAALVHIVANCFKPKLILAVAGGPDKVEFVESLGPNVKGVDYKSASYDEDFSKALGGDKIDVFVDQVGGEILNKASLHMQTFGKIVQVGAISGYNGGVSSYFTNYAVAVITKRLRIQGFVLVDDLKDMKKIVGHMIELFQTGKLDVSKFSETIVDATGEKFTEIPELWGGLFTGANKGKYITQVAKLE